MLKILEWLKKNWKLVLFIGVITYAGITTYLYAHLNGLYNNAVALTESLQRRIDTEMRDLKDALDKAGKIIGDNKLTIDSQRQIIGQLELGKSKLAEINRQLEATNKGLESTNRELDATNKRLGGLIDSLTGLQHEIAAGSGEALDITKRCLELIQQIEDGLR